MPVVVPVVMAVVVVIVVVLFMRWPSAPAKPLAQHRRPDGDDQETGDERQPRVELLGKDELGEREGHDADREDACRVRDRDRSAEHERVARRPRVPTRYAATSALPWPGVRACAAPQNAAMRSETRSTPSRDVSLLDQRLESATLVLRGRRATSIDGGVPGASPSSTIAAALETSSGERSRSFGYARSARLSLVPGTSERMTRAPSRAESVISRQPMRPAKA